MTLTQLRANQFDTSQRRRFGLALHRPLASSRALGLGLCLALNPVFADESAAPTVKIEKVEVTGSSIKRIAGETALPVQVIGRADIQRTGATTTAELLSTVAAASSAGGTNPASSMVSGNAMAGASLRGLGYQRTLVLLNGRRVANNAFDGGGVDLETIPLTAVERVEVLTDGASAVYGADAVGGVINFILIKDYQGVEGTAYASTSQHGGAAERRATLTGGHGDLAADGYNMFLTMDYRKDDALHAASRPYTSSWGLPAIYGSNRYYWLSQFSSPGTAYYGYTDAQGNPQTAIGNISNPDCSGKGNYPSTTGDGTCLYDTGAEGDTIPIQEKFATIGKINLKLSDEQTLFLEASLARNRYTIVGTSTSAQGESQSAEDNPALAGLQAFPGSQTPFVILPNSPYYPAAFASQYGSGTQAVSFTSRLLELGPTATVTANDQERLVLGTSGTWHDWDYDAAMNLNRAHSNERFFSGVVDTEAFYNLALSGLYNPFGPQSAQGLQALRATQWIGKDREATGTVKSIDLHLSKEIAQLPAGPLALALGAEERIETLTQWYQAEYAQGWLLNWGGAGLPASGLSRHITAFSAEADIPLARKLNANLSVRNDHYSDFGSTTNPKFSLKWQPAASLLLRGSYGSGFRAPNLVDVGTPLTMAWGGVFSDPVRCPGGVPVAGANPQYDCANNFTQAKFGNPALKPEKSIQSNLGFVYEPNKQFSAAFSYFRINLGNVIQVNGLPESLAFDPATAAQYAGMLVRFPATPGSSLPGSINYVNTPTLNAGEWRLRGSDIDATYHFDPTAWGRFTVKLSGTYFQNFDILTPGNPAWQGTVGTKNQQGIGVINRWHHYLSLNWQRDAWDVTLGQTYWSGYQDENAYGFFGSNLPGSPQVRSYTLYDLSASYKHGAHLSFNAGIRNLFDTAPPFTNNQEGAGFDPSYAQLAGRTFWVSATYSFH
jgi:iron complex outermembrane receptor protein